MVYMPLKMDRKKSVLLLRVLARTLSKIKKVEDAVPRDAPRPKPIAA